MNAHSALEGGMDLMAKRVAGQGGVQLGIFCSCSGRWQCDCGSVE